MTRIFIRMLLIALVAMTLITMAQLASAPTASAAATCKSYDTYISDAGATRNVRVCAAPSSDYPSYSGWGRIKESSASVLSYGCGHSALLPMDRTDAVPPCYDDPNRRTPAPEYGWRWTGASWVRGPQLNTGTRAYFAPYAVGWRWGWTAQTGWFALPASSAYFLWYA